MAEAHKNYCKAWESGSEGAQSAVFYNSFASILSGLWKGHSTEKEAVYSLESLLQMAAETGTPAPPEVGELIAVLERAN